MDSIARAFELENGGTWMYALALTAALSLGIVVERLVSLFFRSSLNAPVFLSQLQKLILANDVDRAVKLCNAAPSAALARVLKAGLTRASKGPRAIRGALEEARREVQPELQRRAGTLPALAHVATLLGLLGTVRGVTRAFDGLAAVAADERQEALGAALALALHPLAFGLLTAVACVSIHALIAGKASRLAAELDLSSVKLENLLVARAPRAAADRPPAE